MHIPSQEVSELSGIWPPSVKVSVIQLQATFGLWT